MERERELEVEPDLADAFVAAGRTLASRGLVRGSDGNLSVFDGTIVVITRTGAALGSLSAGDLVSGRLNGRLEGASSDVEVHRRAYRERGAGAMAHAHPPGTVPEGGGGPGAHGVYRFGGTLSEAVEAVLRATGGPS